jgi:NTE family protein
MKPRWNINSCAIESGKCWRFLPRKRMGDYILNYVEKPDILFADAICSSAAVPFLIGSLILRTNNYKWFKYNPDKSTEPINQEFKKIHIWDGGVYDNLGVEALVKFENGCVYREELNFLIISDASKVIEPGKPFFQSSAFRLLDITTDQVRSLRARILMDHFEHKKNSGVYLQIGKTVQEILPKSKWEGDIEQASRESLISDEADRAKHYKTTLRKMSDEDFAIIFKHGWEVADATLSAYCPELFSQIKYNGL